MAGKLTQRYGDRILLSPRADGLSAALWVLPMTAPALAVLLAVRRRRRRRAPHPLATSDERPRSVVRADAVLFTLGSLAVAGGAVAIWTSGHLQNAPVAEEARGGGQGEDPVARARALAAAGDHDAAVRAYREVVRQRPDDRSARYLLGFELVRAGRAAEAVTMLAPLLAARSRDPDLLLVLGTARLVTDPAHGCRTLWRFLDAGPPGHAAASRIRALLRSSPGLIAPY